MVTMENQQKNDLSANTSIQSKLEAACVHILSKGGHSRGKLLGLSLKASFGVAFTVSPAIIEVNCGG